MEVASRIIALGGVLIFFCLLLIVSSKLFIIQSKLKRIRAALASWETAPKQAEKTASGK